MLNTTIGTSYSNSFVSLAYFRDYESLRINPVLETFSDLDVEKYLVTASNIINSYQFKGSLGHRGLLYSGKIFITDTDTIQFPNETEETFLKHYNDSNLIGSRFALNVGNENISSGTIEAIYLEFSEFIVDFDLFTSLDSNTDTKEMILNSPTSNTIARYRQSLVMPRNGLYEDSMSIPDLYIPENFKKAVCELACILATRGSESQIPVQTTGQIKKAVLDVMEVEYEESIKIEGFLTPYLKQLLSPYIIAFNNTNVINTQRTV